MGASGSSQMSTNTLVPEGIERHSRGGDTSAPSQVKSLGIMPPFSNTELLKSIGLPPFLSAKAVSKTYPLKLDGFFRSILRTIWAHFEKTLRFHRLF
jgi:hypothetical protein